MAQIEPPPGSEYGLVVAQIIRRTADSIGDVDLFPDTVGAEGTITFRPLRTLSTIDDPSAYEFRDPITGVLNGSGILTGGVESPSIGVWLLVGTYKVTFNIKNGTIGSYNIEVKNTHTTESPLDLVNEAPYVPPVNVKPKVILVPTSIQTDEVLVKGSGGELYGVPLSDLEGGGGGGGGSTPDATESVKGKIKLAGDLGGTADLPTVPALSGMMVIINDKAPIEHTHTVVDITDSTSVGRSLVTAVDKEAARTAIDAVSIDDIGDITGMGDWAGLNTMGVGRLIFIPHGGAIPEDLPDYTLVVEMPED